MWVFASDSQLVQLKAGAGLPRNLPIVISRPHLPANGRLKPEGEEKKIIDSYYVGSAPSAAGELSLRHLRSPA
jgi:hypothetical protein